MRRIVAAVSIALVVMGFGLLAWYLSGYMPGTFSRDKNGVPYGTGWTYYYYESGELMLEEKFVAGKGQYSRWFRPDGSVVAETNWVDESGVGYYLHEDGSIRARMLYVNGLAHGTAVYFDTDGSVIREVMFHEGHEALPEAPYVEIIDVFSMSRGEDRILRVEPLDDETALLQELNDLAFQHFPNGTWVNFGPDSAYRQIVFFSSGRKIELRSWHPIYEQEPDVVAGSEGVTSLVGETREEFLAQDDPKYVAQRRAFDEIEARLRQHHGS